MARLPVVTVLLTTALSPLSCPLFGQLLAVNSSADNNPAPSALPEAIIDSASGYTYAGFVSSDARTAFGPLATSPRAMGSFSNGTVAAGTLLPTNQNASGDAEYAGGIGITSGICLCTGASSDTDTAGAGLPPDRGVGAQGPNNGYFGPNAGEISVTVLGGGVIDLDFDEHVFDGLLSSQEPSQNSGDPTVLVFRITLNQPGFLRLCYVFASDEFPHYVHTYNDSFAFLIKKDACGVSAPYENIAKFKEPGMPPKPFTLLAAWQCGEKFFKRNQLAPSPTALFVGPPASPHAIDDTPGQEPYEYDTAVPYFDHEFGGFTIPLVSETPQPISVGTYTIKLVVHDVKDANVDSALFIEDDSLKLFALQQGDYNGDGIVDYADYYVWVAHFGQSPATFYDGDGTGDCCVVDSADYVRWRNHQGQTGNADLAADLDRDGCVGQGDLDLVLLHWGIPKCASRFEGDANGDGAVFQADLDQVLIHWGEGVCGQALMAGGGWEGVQAQLDAAGIAVDVEQFAAAREELAGSAEASGSPSAADLARIPESPDLNGDGQVDADEIARLTKIVYEAYFGASESPASVSASADEPVSSAYADVASASTPEPVQVLPEPESMPEDEFVLVDETVPAEEAPLADEPPPVDEAPPTPPPGPFGLPLPVPPGAPR